MDNSKKLIVFDIDGTLTDSVSLYHKAVIKCLKMMGIEKVDTNFSDYKYHTDSYGLKWNYENNFNRPYNSKLLEIFENLLYDELLRNKPVAEVRGAKNCVQELLNAGCSIAFATGSLLKPAKIKLDQCGIWYDDNLIATSAMSFDRETFVLKAINNAKKFFNIDEFDSIYSVGDGIWDMETSIKLGLNFIGVGTAHKEKLLSRGCSIHFDDLTQLSSYLI